LNLTQRKFALAEQELGVPILKSHAEALRTQRKLLKFFVALLRDCLELFYLSAKAIEQWRSGAITIHNPHSAFRNLQSTITIPKSAFRNLQSTIIIPHSEIP